HDDVRTWPQPDTERVDVIAGGFPCQDISYAGKGAGLAGERSGLFFELAQIVREMGPRIVVLENVAALLTRGMGEVLGTLASLGLDAEWTQLQAFDMGAPHARKRVFIVAYRKSDGDTDGGKRTRRAVLDINRKTLGDADCLCMEGQRPDRQQIMEARHFEWKPESTGHGRGYWATEPDVGRVANGVPARVDRLRGLGNAVVPQVAEYIGRRIVEAYQ
uniref:DNA cytosine methyltransferase n=1 Tax=Stieleria sp. TaxID=2795976 RepID=UPI00356A9A21